MDEIEKKLYTFVGSANTNGACQGFQGFRQRKGTCWLNAIFNALFASKKGSVLTRALYVDWVIGFRDATNKKKRDIQRQFVEAYEISCDGGHSLSNGFRVEALISKLHSADQSMFPNIGSQKGFKSEYYIHNLLIYMGINPKQIVWITIQSDFQDYYAKVSKKVFENREAMVVLVHIEQPIEPEERLTLPVNYLKINNVYDLDACILSERQLGPGAEGGHAIAGVTRARSRALIDSNGSRTKFDWASSDHKTTETATPGYIWSSRSHKRTLIYYHATLLELYLKKMGGIATAYLQGTKDTSALKKLVK